jgi:hypothetical protein
MKTYLGQGSHPNSVNAYHAEETKLSKRAEAVLAWITKHGPHTDREIAYGMGFGENLNAVRPRITELLGICKLMEVCNRKCPITKKTVRVLDIRRARQERLFTN